MRKPGADVARVAIESSATLPAHLDGDPPMVGFRFAQLLEAVRRRWLTVILTAILIAGPGIYWIRGEVPVYKAGASIRLRDVQGEITGGLTGGPIGDLTRSVDPVKSQIEVLTSRAVASQVVDSAPELRIDAIGFPATALDSLHVSPSVGSDSIGLEFLPAVVVARTAHGGRSAVYGALVDLDGVRFIVPKPLAARGTILIRPAESVVDHLMGNLQVRPRDQTDVIDVTYFDTDPKRAQRVVNRVITVYQLASAGAAQQRSIRRREFLEGQLRFHDSIADAARAQLSLFRGRQRAYSTKARLSTEQTSLMQLQVQREAMVADRRLYQDLLSELQRSSSTPDDGQVGAIMSVPGIATNPVVAELFAQLTRYQTARDSLTTGRFGRPATNPDVQQLDAMILSTKRKLTGAVGSYLGSVDARIASLDRLWSQSSSTFPGLSASEEEETRLEEQVEASRGTISQLRSEYEKARLAEAVEVGQVEIVSFAPLPKSPIGVGPVRKTVFLVLLGFALGIGLAFLLERLNTSVRRQGQVRELLGVAELAIIPPVASRRRRLPSQERSRARRTASHVASNGRLGSASRLGAGLIVASDVHSIAAEAYRLLRTNLLFSLPEGPLRTVLVTSPAPGDGKTTVAANLAIAFAHQGMRVLLVDADLRRGRIHDLFDGSREPGLANLLAGEISLDAALRPTPIGGLFVLTTGTLPDAPNELLGADAMRTFLRDAIRQFAIVVIDSPPVLAASDAAVISTISDATVIVVRAGRTHEQEAQATVSQLIGVGGNVVGAVLNDPDAAVEATAGYYYYKEYYGNAKPH